MAAASCAECRGSSGLGVAIISGSCHHGFLRSALATMDLILLRCSRLPFHVGPRSAPQTESNSGQARFREDLPSIYPRRSGRSTRTDRQYCVFQSPYPGLVYSFPQTALPPSPRPYKPERAKSANGGTGHPMDADGGAHGELPKALAEALRAVMSANTFNLRSSF